MKDQKVVCHKCHQEGKYRMPGTDMYYCSVTCYKALKASLPAREPEKSKTVSPAAEVNEEETLEAPRPLKRLRDLDWPEEPDASFWNDPLKRDELKPLRNFELEAVAKSTELRKLMQENPTLPALLQQTFSDPSMPPTVFLRHIMGISTASTSASAPQNYRGRGRGRGMRGQHNRGRGRGGGPMRPAEAAPPPSPETVQLMHKFADLIKSILSEARQQKPA